MHTERRTPSTSRAARGPTSQLTRVPDLVTPRRSAGRERAEAALSADGARHFAFRFTAAGLAITHRALVFASNSERGVPPAHSRRAHGDVRRPVWPGFAPMTTTTPREIHVR